MFFLSLDMVGNLLGSPISPYVLCNFLSFTFLSFTLNFSPSQAPPKHIEIMNGLIFPKMLFAILLLKATLMCVLFF